MSIAAVNNVGGGSGAGPSAAPGAAGQNTMTPRQRELRKAVNELVGGMFFGEIFKAVRESKLKGAYGHGGRGEEIFSAQLHDVLAKRMGRSAKLGINESLYRRFAKKV